MFILYRAPIVVLLMGLCLAPLATQAASKPVKGCQLLQQQASLICMAKVSCSNSTPAIDHIRPLFAGCAAGQQVPATAVQNAIDRFESALVFQCCIGNDLMSSLPQH